MRHDLDLTNLKDFSENVPFLEEVSIGHALISDALYLGMEDAVKQYLSCLSKMSVKLFSRVLGSRNETDLIILHGLLGSADNWQTLARNMLMSIKFI